MTTTNIEKEYVHQVYENIAFHFSQTRYKPWPLVEKFLNEIPSGSLVADVGCGNGKYMGCNENAFFIGSDRSFNLIAICAQKGFESLVADNLKLPFRDSSFDYVLSIAVLHHFSTEENRLRAIEELTRILRTGGYLLITVWALEQDGKKYDQQDVLIPWHLLTKKPKRNRGEHLATLSHSEQQNDRTFVQKSTKKRRSKIESQTKEFQSTSTVDLNNCNTANEQIQSPTPHSEEKVFQRYYHLFAQNELDDLVKKISQLIIVESKWDHDNWYLKAKKAL